MMIQTKAGRWAILALIFLTAGCSATTPPAAGQEGIGPTTSDASRASAIQTEVAEPVPEAVTDVATPVVTEAGWPSAPASIDGDFRADPATVVAATGQPQVLEFFTYW